MEDLADWHAATRTTTMVDPNDEKALARDGELPPNGAPDTTRRDALARSLCARIADVRRDEFALSVLDRALTLIENEERAATSLVERLQNDRFNLDEGDDDERSMRAIWNSAIEHAAAIVLLDEATTLPVAKVPAAGSVEETRMVAALRELRDAPVSIPRTRAIELDTKGIIR